MFGSCGGRARWNEMRSDILNAWKVANSITPALHCIPLRHTHTMQSMNSRQLRGAKPTGISSLQLNVLVAAGLFDSSRLVFLFLQKSEPFHNSLSICAKCSINAPESNAPQFNWMVGWRSWASTICRHMNNATKSTLNFEWDVSQMETIIIEWREKSAHCICVGPMLCVCVCSFM